MGLEQAGGDLGHPMKCLRQRLPKRGGIAPIIVTVRLVALANAVTFDEFYVAISVPTIPMMRKPDDRTIHLCRSHAPLPRDLR